MWMCTHYIMLMSLTLMVYVILKLHTGVHGFMCMWIRAYMYACICNCVGHIEVMTVSRSSRGYDRPGHRHIANAGQRFVAEECTNRRNKHGPSTRPNMFNPPGDIPNMPVCRSYGPELISQQGNNADMPSTWCDENTMCSNAIRLFGRLLGRQSVRRGSGHAMI